MSDITRLLRLMADLRHPEHGCPWDVKQTFASIAPYTIEEAYEVADAIERGEPAQLKDELGDLLLQVVFHARMAEEAGQFAFADVVGAICDKLVRRHPHVFTADGALVDPAQRLADADEQTARWDAIKQAERGARRSVLDGVGSGMPEFQRATKLQQRAATVGFDWASVEPVLDKLHEEIDEVREELAREPRNATRLDEEIGDVLFVCANLARHAGVDPGAALRRANLKFERRFRAMEDLARADGVALDGLPLADQDVFWERAKQLEKGAGPGG